MYNKKLANNDEDWKVSNVVQIRTASVVRVVKALCPLCLIVVYTVPAAFLVQQTRNNSRSLSGHDQKRCPDNVDLTKVTNNVHQAHGQCWSILFIAFEMLKWMPEQKMMMREWDTFPSSDCSTGICPCVTLKTFAHPCYILVAIGVHYVA